MNLGDLIKKALGEESAEQKATDTSNEASGQTNPNRKMWDSYALKAKQSGAMHLLVHEALEPIRGGFHKNLPDEPDMHPAFLYGKYHGEKEVWLWSTGNRHIQKRKLKRYTSCRSTDDCETFIVSIEKESCEFVLLGKIQNPDYWTQADFDRKWAVCGKFPNKIQYVVAHSRFFDCVKYQCQNTGNPDEFTYRGHIDSDTHDKIIQGVKLSRRGN